MKISILNFFLLKVPKFLGHNNSKFRIITCNLKKRDKKLMKIKQVYPTSVSRFSELKTITEFKTKKQLFSLLNCPTIQNLILSTLKISKFSKISHREKEAYFCSRGQTYSRKGFYLSKWKWITRWYLDTKWGDDNKKI